MCVCVPALVLFLATFAAAAAGQVINQCALA